MIQFIDIQNFQSHAHTKLEFHAGVNVIVGTSDSGKSAIIRAINWVLTNRPLGDEFRSYWGGSTQVRIQSDDAVVERTKSDKANVYLVNEQVLKAFGTSVPDEVLTALKFQPVNMQSQMDAPFMLSLSAGEVASTLNRIVNLDEIDTSMSNVSKSIRELNSTIKYESDKLSSLEKDVEQFANLEQIDKMLTALELTDKRIDELVSKAELLISMAKEIEQCEALLGPLFKRLQHAPLLETLEYTYSVRKAKFDACQSVARLIDDISSNVTRTTALKRILESPVSVDDLLEKNKERITLSAKLADINVTISAINDIVSEIKSANLEEQRLTTVLYEKMPSECPLCEQPILVAGGVCSEAHK